MYNNYLKIQTFLCLLFFSTLVHSETISETIKVFVSILPQQYIVERIGGDYVNVNVMLKPGQSPMTFEPSPKLMSLYSKSNVYFTIGLPFEQVWIDRVASLNDAISIVKTQPVETQAIEKTVINDMAANESTLHDKDYTSLLPGHHHSWDPHTWLSPVLILQQAKIILHTLNSLVPENKTYFNNNYNKLEDEINVMHKEISSIFQHNSKHNFITFHPAFSYFARQYGLTQIAIEMDGKEPSAKQIAQVINRIRNENVSYILIEKQFNQVIPQTIAKSVGARLLALDPLALDYLVNMRDIADKINRALF